MTAYRFINVAIEMSAGYYKKVIIYWHKWKPATTINTLSG